MKDKIKHKIAEIAAEQNLKGISRIPKAPSNLVAIVTVVNRGKADFYMDFLQSFEINMQTAMAAHGTEKDSGAFSNAYTEKAVLISIARDEKKKDILDALHDKFDTVRGGGGIAYAVPLTGVIGVAIYSFLSNQVR